ncbi:MAG: DNA translocase FtsK [Lentisphaerae bacterium]|jgi:S-DNA-T family DNA segregation ATPase FtsK/SpoIIIE|nr:DNA translocase FtsK [Lentisphaerota bacterium]
MAAKKKKVGNVRREATGILLQAVWLLLLLALASYTWQDVVWEHSPPNDPTVNYIGPVGAWAAWGIFKVFGLVGFVFPLALAIWGLLMIFQSAERVWPRVLWLLGILCALGVLVDLHEPFWSGLAADRLNLNRMPGGLVGFFVGRNFLTCTLGVVGSAIISIGVIVGGIFFVLRANPATLWRGLVGIWQGMAARQEEWAAKRRTAQQQAAREARLLEKERRRLEKELERERRAREKDDREREREEARREKEAAKLARAEELRREKEEAEQREREAVLQRQKEAAEREAAQLKQQIEQREAEMRRVAEVRRQAEAKRQAEAAAVAAATAAKAAAAAETTAAQDDAGDQAETPAKSWVLPPMALLEPIPEGAGRRASPEDLEQTIQTIRGTLAEFGIEAEVTHVEQGPAVTRYELLPAAGVKVERIGNLAANITLALKADSVRVQAPIPGKGVVGIEVPNRRAAPVVLRQLLESSAWMTSKSSLPLALGQDVGGHVLLADLATLPHLLIAGATGQGKTVCMNSLLAGLLMSLNPDELRLILIDPKIVEFSGYNGLPHLLTPVITKPKDVIRGLRIAIQEMERRFKLFHRAKVRDIRGFNHRPKVEQAALFEANGDPAAGAAGGTPEEEPLPDRLAYWVIVIDELADLMLMAQQEIEPQIQKLTQLARATGVHMIIATQRPTVDIITGTIKANIPGRVAFKVAQKNDSRVILDQEGGDKLVGKGDMLVLTGANKLIRAQGAWTKDEEIQRIADYWKQQDRPAFDGRFDGRSGGGGAGGAGATEIDEEDEELLQQAIEVIRQSRRASTSYIQRRLRIGYTRAARLIDVLEEKGMLGPMQGTGPREILFPLDDPEDDPGDFDEDDELS